ncbi:MAG: T9SS C-terminal target domain-containing protein [Chlorobiota bacterium]|nr:MAG: T9SS C-terminal target domain-containing protein [Chlorobiota bacterium]
MPARGSAIAGYAELKVYNSAGELVKVLMNGEMPAGEHSVEFNAVDLPSGIYFYRLGAGSTSLTKKMTLLK